jgi:hypothetical protein
MRFKLILLLLAPIMTLLLLLLSSVSTTSPYHKAYATHNCIKGVELAIHTNSSSMCLDPYELESACTPPGGSLAGNPVCTAIHTPAAIRENFPLVNNYSSNTSNVPGGEQEVMEEGQGIPEGEQEVIEEGQGIPEGEQEVIEEGQGIPEGEQEVIEEGEGVQ